MKEAHKKFARVFAAFLPALPFLGSFPEAFWLASFTGAGVLFTVYLFKLLKPLFPKNLFRLAAVLFLAVIFQLVQGFFHPSPLWMVSLTLLLDWNDFDPKHLGQRPLAPLVRVGIFWCGALFLGAVRDILGKHWGAGVFNQPAGMFAALAVFSALILGLEKPMAPLWMKKRREL